MPALSFTHVGLKFSGGGISEVWGISEVGVFQRLGVFQRYVGVSDVVVFLDTYCGWGYS